MSESANSTAEENPTKFTAAFRKKLNETTRIEFGAKKCKLESTCETDSVKNDDGRNFYSSESLLSDAGIERDFPNTVVGREGFSSLEQKPRRHSVAPSPDLRINDERCDRNDSTFRCCSDSTSKLRDDSGDSRLRYLERETGTSLTCLASSNSQCIEEAFGSSCFHSVGVQREPSEGHPKNRKRSRLKSKSCDNLPLKKNCDSDQECRPAVSGVVNSREIDKRNKKNRLFSSSVSNNLSKQDDSKKKRKFIIILKGVLNCNKKKKLDKGNEPEKTKTPFPVEEKFSLISNYDRSPLVKRNYSVSSGNLCYNSNRIKKTDFEYDSLKRSLCSVYEESNAFSATELNKVENAENAKENYRNCRSSSTKNSSETSSLNLSSESRYVEITASRSAVPEWADAPLDNEAPPARTHSTHEFLTLLYHESLLQRFVDAPDRCTLAELPKTGGSQFTQETAPLPITGIPESSDQTNLSKKIQVEENELGYSSVSEDDDNSSDHNNSSQEFNRTATTSSDYLLSVGDQFITGNNNLETDSYNELYKSGSLLSLLETDKLVNTSIEINDNEVEINNLDVENNFINELYVDSINHNNTQDNYKEESTDIIDNYISETNCADTNFPDHLLNEDLILDNFLAQKERALPNDNDNSVINSDNFNEESDEETYGDTSESSNEISDEETSDSSVDYDATPIDDKYFDLHYDPYYYHGSYSLDDIPVDQPIDYPSPYVVPTANNAYVDTHNENWWQQFDGKPGRELYRSQSQPKDLGSNRDDEPLDGNLPLHLFLSASQPLGKKTPPIIRSRSNSLESLSSRRRSEVGSLCSSYGSQLYTITEELETDEVFEEHNPHKFNSCINFGEENFVDYEYAPETSNSSQHFRRVYKSSEEVRRTLSHPCGDLININEIKETQIISYPDEVFLFYKENDSSEMKGECNTNIASTVICAYQDVQDKTKSQEDSATKITKDNDNSFENCLKSKPMNSNMSNVYKENGVSSPTYLNMAINRGLSRSSPNIAVDCESTFERDFMDLSYIPTPAKRHNVHNGIKEIHTYQNIPANSKSLESPYAKVDSHVMSGDIDNFCSQNGNGRLSEKMSDDSNDSDYESNFNSDKYSMMHPEEDHQSLSSSEEYIPTSKSLSEAMSNSITSGNFSLNLNCDFSFEDKVNPPSCFTSGVPSFSAYSSDTSLDFDTFSKSSKVFKWNGSSSISDLTSLSKEFDKRIVPSRGASSVSDLRSVTSTEVSTDGSLGRTSYMQWSAQVKDDFENDDDELALPLNLKSTSSFVFTPHAQGNRNSHMSFFGGCPSDAFHSDEEGDSEDFSNSSGSDSAEDDGMMRSYHIGSSHSSFNLGMSENTGLATIAEDVEEDSGGESSSGHWLFSADNTDTDSVIHVPPPLTLASTLPIQFENDIGLCHHSSSEETLVASEDEVIIISDTNVINEEIWKNMMKTSERKAKKCDKNEISKTLKENLVEMTDNKENDLKLVAKDVVARIPTTDISKNLAFDYLKKAPLVNFNQPFSTENVLEATTYSFDTSNIKLVNSLQPTSIATFKNINGTAESGSEKEFEQKPFSLMTNEVFENQIDDIFDFSSLDTCEEVSMSSYITEGSRNTKEGSSLAMEGDSVIFNTSATSEPFSDKKGKLSTDGRLSANGLGQTATANKMGSDMENILNGNEDANKVELRNVENEILDDGLFGKSLCGIAESVSSISYKESNSENTQKIVTSLNKENLNGNTYLDNITSKTHSVNDIQNRFSHSSSDEEMKSEADGHFTDLLVIQNSESPKNTISSLKEMETNGEALNSVLTNGENLNDASKLSLFTNGKGKQKRSCHRQNPRVRPRKVLRHSETSDGDTDDTDGDFEDDTRVYKKGKTKIIYSKSPSSDKAESENSAQLQIVSSFNEVPPSRAVGKDLHISASDNLEGGAIPSVAAEGSGINEQNTDFPINLNQCTTQQHKETNRNRVLLRPLSLGDLRYYSSDSETEEETSGTDNRTMAVKYNGVHPPFPRRQISSPSNISSTFDNLEEKKLVEKTSAHSNGPHRPRRHQSLYSPTSKQPISENGVRINSAFSYRRSVARPKPLSLDMAEEFLSQEGLKSPVRNYNPYAEKIQETFTREKTISSLTTKGGSANSDTLPFTKNQTGNNINILRRESHITTTSTPDLTDESPWLSAQKQPPRHPLLPDLPRYSGEPQLPLSSQASNVVLWPTARVNTPQSAPHSDDSSRLEHNKHILSMRAQVKEVVSAVPDPNLDMCERVNKNMKTFGANEEGEVYFEKNLKVQSPSKGTSEDVHSKHAGSRGVRFSPSVEEVPITYMEIDDSDYLFTQMEEKKVTKVKVVSSESPPLQKLTPKVTSFFSPPRDEQLGLIVNNITEVNKTDISNNKFQNQMNSDAKSVQNKDNVSTTFGNGNSSELSETPSLRRVPTPESPRSPTPIWQRLKLVKIGSPKGPRPKIPPKPPSLSPRSSDGETPRASSCSSPESGLSSPSSPEFKFKKIPTSPRFFSWGSKREKKEKDKNNKNSDRNSHPKEASAHPPQKSASLTSSSSPSPILDYPQVKRKETQVEGSYIINNSKERDETDDATRANLSTSLQSNYNANETELKKNSVKSRIFNGFHQKEKENENDFLKTRESILKQLKSARPTLNKVTKVEPSNSLNTSASPSTPSLSPSSDSDSILDDISSTHSDAKPPLPPSFQNRGGSQVLSKTRAHNVRRQYLTPNKQNATDINGNAQAKELTENTKEFVQPQLNATVLSPALDCAYRNRGKSASERLKERFERFSKATRAERERLARSTPDLSQIEESVRRLQPRIDWNGSGRSNPSPHSGSDGDATGLSSVVREEVRSTHRSSLRGGEAPYRNTFSRVSAEFDRISLRSRTRSVGLLETDLDTGASREVLSPQETNLDDLYQDLQNFLETLPQVPLLSSAPKEKTRAKSQSLRHLDAAFDPPQIMESNLTASRAEDSRAKSMEFLLDDNNRAAAQAPENELMKEGERKVSEAELRIRRSLQRLDVPEWMKTANTQQGFILRRRDHTMGATSGGWSAFSSKTGSMSSLGSSKTNTPITPTKVVIPTRMSTRSYGGITSPSSTASISPSPSDKGSLFTYPLSRWSTSRINSGTTTPTGSFTSQRTASYTRQPYLGWRSNTSLTSLGGSQSSLTTSAYLSPAERLALTILPNQQSQNALQKSNVVTMDSGVTSEGSPKQKFDRAQAADVHSSIKEVTSAIVHYCTETASPRLSPRASPNPSNRASSPRRRVWVESSFVGSRPITSPETPTSTPTPLTPPPINGHKEEMVVDTRPSHLTEEGFSFLNYFSGGSDIIHAGHKDHQLSSFIKSTETSIYDSSTILIDSRVESQNSSNEEDQFLLESQKHLRNDKCNQSENSSRHSTADTINSAISSREIDSLNSRNSGDSSMSRDSSASRHSSSGKEGSRDELPTYAGSCEEINDVTSEGLQVPLQNSNFLSLTDDSTLTASCHSSFGTFQIEEELIPKTPDAKPPTKLKLEVATSLSTTETRQSINSRRFSEGASPWEPSSYLKPFEKKSKKAEDEVDMDTISEGYGFNFSSYPKNDIPEADIQEAHTESTTLEDVLDSLLALPSASRSPSPSGGPHPLSLVRPCTPHSFLSNESSSTSKADSRDQDLDFKMDDSHFSYLRNHDFDPDFKTQSYHKSISYASSSFAPSSFSNQEKLEKHGSENPSSRSITSQDGDKTSVTFYLGKDEGEYTTTQSDALPAPNESLKVAGEFQNAIAKNEDCKHTYKHDDATKSLTKSVPNTAQVAHPFSAFSQLPLNSCFDKDWSNHSNPSNLLGFDSYRSSETVAGGSPMETDKPEKVVVAKEHKETKVTFRLPPKHMNIPPDSSSENENGSENFRVDMDDDDDAPSSSDPLGMTIHCRNHLCSNTATVEEARATYKTCHNCSVFYCSRECRRSHWEKHKKFCEKIRATTAAREIVDRVKEDSSVIEFMSSVARRGILSVGRGAVKIFFPDTSSAEKFVTDGHIHEAHYQALQNIMPQEMGSEIYKKLVQQCRSYNPEIKFILYVSICTFSETPTVSSHKFRRETVGKCAKLRLAEQNTQATISITTKPKSNHSEHHVITRDLNEPETLILTTVPEANYGLPPRQTREVAFSNIVRELQERGVNLRTQYADVYRKLAHYVDTGGSFPPLTIYPKDSRRGSSFMCIIMPEADPSRLERVGSNDSKVRTVDISRPHPAIS